MRGLKKGGGIMPKYKNWKREGTFILLQKNGKKYALDPKKLDWVFAIIC
jgi:hypothetical protein